MKIIGHQYIRNRLQKLTKLSEHPQSFVFSGPENVGKRLVALEFAWTLIGEGTSFLSRSDGELLHPDIAVVSPERVTEKGKTREKNISVEIIREHLHFLSRYPLVGKRRVLVIDDAHQLSRGAQNVLLKTLEEPNVTSVLILITHDMSALLDTIHSRVQHIRFSCVPESEMRMLGEVVNESDMFLYSLGRPGVLITASQHAEEFADSRALLSRLLRLSELGFSERLILAEDLAKESVRAIRLLTWIMPAFRQSALNAGDTHRTRAIFLFLSAFLETGQLLRGTQANARLQFEKLLLSL